LLVTTCLTQSSRLIRGDALSAHAEQKSVKERDRAGREKSRWLRESPAASEEDEERQSVLNKSKSKKCFTASID
jgi:hypothetical protein